MLREEISWEWKLRGIVAHGVVIGHDVGIVGTVEGEIGEERGGVFFL